MAIDAGPRSVLGLASPGCYENQAALTADNLSAPVSRPLR